MNYQKVLEKTLEGLTGKRPKLLLHVCCAPCSSYVMLYLSKYFDIVIDFYNPNISPAKEYDARRAQLLRLISQMPQAQGITVLADDYDPRAFYALVSGLEDEREGGARCERCYRLRLEHAARQAKAIGADFFTTTLTISPHKNAALLNEMGCEIASAHGLDYLCSDFKKKEGFKQSISLSEQYDLYRQDYCGCIYSQRDRANERI